MYNPRQNMSRDTFQIRACQNAKCGLRYPVIGGTSFGERCPSCLGQTLVVTERSLEWTTPHADQWSNNNSQLSVLLDNVRSGWNVGSILRSADGLGVHHVYLCGITPSPENTDVQKTALGAEECVSWSTHKNGVELAKMLQKQGYEILALEQTKNSTSLKATRESGRRSMNILLVVGNEVTGVDPGILEIADQIAHLTMRGQKRSFNVAIAFALAVQILGERH